MNVLLTQLRAAGFNPTVETFEGGGRAGPMQGSNVVVTIGDGAKEILLTAHYDAVKLRDGTMSQGVVDNAGSVVALIEAAKILRDKPLTHRVRVIFFDQEELGLIGARKWIEAHGIANVAAVVNSDVAAYGDTLMYGQNNGARSAGVTRAVREVCAERAMHCVGFPVYPPSDDRAFSGAGLLTIESGTFTLTGTADLGTTGTIDLSGGRLPIADGGTLALRDRSLVTGNVTNNGLIDFNNIANYTFAAKVDGTGSFLIDSSGRVEITAANTATGGATIAENSTLALSGDGAIAGTIVNEGTLEVVTTPGASRIIPANITGAGDFLLSGGGTIQISGDLAYSGDTRLSDGTTLNSCIHENETSTFSSTIYGTGNLMKSGAGTLVMVNNSAFNGDVTIMNGTLQIGDGGTTGYLYADTITVNGTLAYNVSAPNQIGAISGFGGIRQMGTGLLTIAADNPNLLGTTTVDAGRTLQIGHTAGDAGSVGGEIAAEGSLWLNRTGTYTHGGGLAGSGTFQKTLAGDLRLENNFDFAGQLTVGDGGLITDGRTGSRLHDITANSLTNVATGNLIVTGNNSLATTNAGRLTLGDGGTTGWVGNSIANSGVLEINRSNDVTLGFGTNVTGNGTISQLGTGTLYIAPGVSAANLTVSNGTMVLDSLFTGHEDLSVGSQGAGTLVLYGGTYDYGVSIGGFLRADAGFSDITLNNASVTGGLEILGGTLFLPSVGVLTLDRPLAGNGNLRFGDNLSAGARWLTLNADNTHTGTIYIGSGPFGTVTVAGDLASTLNFSAPGGTVNFTNTGDATFTGNLVNVAALNFNGTGDAILATAVTAPVTLNAGSLTLATGGSVDALTVNHGSALLDGGALDALTLNAADASLDLSAADATLTRLSGSAGSIALGARTLTLNQSVGTSYAGAIAGTGDFVKTGFGAFALEGDNTFTGDVTVTSGLLHLRGTNTASAYLVETDATLTLNSATNLGSAPATLQPDLITLHGGELGTETSVELASTHRLSLDGGGTLSATGTLTLNSQIAGTGTLTIDDGRVLFNAANTYAGAVAVNGTLALGRVDAIDPLATTFASGSTFDLNGFNWSNDLAAQGVTVANGAATDITVSSALTLTDSFGLSGNGRLHFTGTLGAPGGDGSVSLSSNGNVRVDTASGALIGTLGVGSGNLSIDLDAIPNLAQVNLSGTGGLTFTGAARDLNLGIGLIVPLDVGGDTVSLLNNTDGALRLQTDLNLAERDALRRSVVLIGGDSDLTLAGTIYGEASLTKVGAGNLTIESNVAGWDNANSGARIGVREGTLTTGLGLLNRRTLVFEGAGSHLAITDPASSTYILRSLLGDDADANLDLGSRNVTFEQNTSGEYLGAITTTGTLTMDVDPLNVLPIVPDRQTLGTVNAGSFVVNYGDVTVTTALNTGSVTIYSAFTTTFDFTNENYITVYGPQASWTSQGSVSNNGTVFVQNGATWTSSGAFANDATFYVFGGTIAATAFHQNAGTFEASGTLAAPLHVNGGVFEIGGSSTAATLTVEGGVTLNPGGLTRWKFAPLNGTADAAATDLLQIANSTGHTDGQLIFASASAQLPTMVQVDAAGFPYAADFTQSHSWAFASTTDGVIGFDPATVFVRPRPSFNLANAVNGQGNFGLQVAGNDVNVVYDPSTVINVDSDTTILDTPIGASGTYDLGGLTKFGNGTLSITAANTYTGYTQMMRGILQIGNDAALGTGAVIWNSGTIRSDGTARSLANTFYLQGNLTVAGDSDLTFTGSMTNVADSNRTLTVNNTGLTTFGDIVATGSPTSNQLTPALTFNVATGTTSRVDGVVSDGLRSSSLNKNTGTGTLILAGENTYTGATTVNAGTLIVNGSIASSSLLTVNSGATLGGSGTIGSTVINSDATFAPGNSPGLLTVDGNLTLAGIARMELAGLLRGTSYDAIDVDGSIAFGGTLDVVLLGTFSPSGGSTFNLFDWTGDATGWFMDFDLPDLAAGLSWNTDALYTSGVISVTGSAIPEPSTSAALLGACVLGLAIVRKRRAR
jgi:autotransporter-associated beta strand protein